MLITSFWEAYCEDLAEDGLDAIVEHAPTSDVLPKEIKKPIANRLKADPNDLAVWQVADGKWRQVLTSNLAALKEARNRRLNTPKSINIDELFEAAIGLSEVSSSWRCSNKLSPDKARLKLDAFVELRGEIAHRGKAKTSVKKSQVVAYRDFIRSAAAATGTAPRSLVNLFGNQRANPSSHQTCATRVGRPSPAGEPKRLASRPRR